MPLPKQWVSMSPVPSSHMKIAPWERLKCSLQKGHYLLNNFGERPFFDISSPPTATFGGKKYWLLDIEGITNYAWSFSLKEKLDLAA